MTRKQDILFSVYGAWRSAYTATHGFDPVSNKYPSFDKMDTSDLELLYPVLRRLEHLSASRNKVWQ